MSGVGWVPNEGAKVSEMFAEEKNSGLPEERSCSRARTEAVLGGSGSTRRGSSAYKYVLCLLSYLQ